MKLGELKLNDEIASALGADDNYVTDAEKIALHASGSDTALGTLGTKNPPIDADKAIYRDSTASDGLVTSTWTQIKAFLKTYFDTLYQVVGSYLTSANISDTAYDATSWNAVATIAPSKNAVRDAMENRVALNGLAQFINAQEGEMTTPSSNDNFLVEDAETDYGLQFLTFANLKLAVLSAIYPIGCIYTEITGVNPATTFGFGTWVAFGAGKVLIGLDSGDTDFDTVEETGGAKTVQSSAQSFAGDVLGAHQHNAITAGTPAGTIPNHLTASKYTVTGGATAVTSATHIFTGTQLAAHQHDAITAGTPSGTNTPGAETSVVQPYIVVYMWKRNA